MKAAAIYARISKDPDGTRAGVDRQVKECRAWAESHDVPVLDIYVDNDTSAYKGKSRPEYQRMCSDLAEGTVDGVIAWHLDRLHRHPVELESFIKLLEDTRADVHTVTGSDFDLSTSDGRTMARVIGAFARKESEDKSRRIKSAKYHNVRQGKLAVGGYRPYGYTDGRRSALVPAECAIIKEAAARILAGESLRSLCLDLNQRGIPTVRNVEWSPTVIKRLLISPALSGQVTHLGEVVAEGSWDTVLTKTQTTRLVALLTNPKRSTYRPARRYPLKGLLRCWNCNATLTGRPQPSGQRRYVCARSPGSPGCGKVAIVAESLEEFIAEAVLYRLDTPDLQRKLLQTAADDGEAAELQHTIDEAARQLEELAEAFGQEKFSLQEWFAAREPIENRKQHAQNRSGQLVHSSALTPYMGNANALRGQWSDLAASRQTAIIAALAGRITINRGTPGRRTFDPDRVTVEWRA